MKITFHRLVLLGLAGAALVCSSRQVRAGQTWDGGGTDNNWSTAANWSSDSLPAYGTLIFSGTLRVNNNNNSVTAMNQVNWNGAAAWTMTGSSTLSLFDFGGTQSKLESLGTGGVTINAPITFAANNGSPPNPFGEINAVNSDLLFSGGTVTVNGSSCNGIKLFGGSRVVTFNNTVSATGKWFGITTSGTGNTITIGGSFTASDFYVMNDGTLNLTNGGSLSTAVRLGGDFGNTGNQNLTKTGSFNLVGPAGGLTFSGVINAVTGNTSGTLAVNSQNTSGVNTLSGHPALDSALRITQAAGGALNITQTKGGDNSTGTDIKGNTLTLTPATGATITHSGTIYNSTGSGNIRMNGAGTLILSGANTYTGTTTVSNGTLFVNGSTSSGAVTVVTNTRVGGVGTIGGAVTVQSGGTLAAGTNGIGTLTLSVAPSLGGTIIAEINRTNSPNADKIVLSSGTLNFGGNLIVTNIGPSLTNGSTFDLFDGAKSGAFATTNLPPGGAQHWLTSQLVVDGTIMFTNNNPVASALALGVAAGGSNTVLVMGGKHTPTDADGDTVTISAVTQGTNGTVSFTSTNLTYTSTNSTAVDSFTYTVSDGVGGTDTKTVTVSIANPEGFNRLSPPSVIGPGTVALSYLGVPGYNYALDWATNLTPPINWQGGVTNTAGANGSMLFTNSSGDAQNYFRTRYVGP